MINIIIFFFFFQAEDGIRDDLVTGVQTCALPICPGLPRRISEHQRGRIIQLARSEPPGRLHQGSEGLGAPADPEAPAHWTLNALAEAAQAEGIQVGRSQVRRILLAERVRWRRTRSWATSTDPDFAPKEPASSPSTPPRPRRRR